MGPNSFRNLTYAAVMAVVGILAYLIYQSSQKQKAKRIAELAQNAEIPSGLNALGDSLGGLTVSTTAALASGASAAGATASAAANNLISPAAAGAKGNDVKNVTVEDVTSLSSETSSSVPSSSTKTPVTTGGGKKAQSPATKKPIVKFDAGTGGEFMAMAGAFASKDNAEALVTKLKKLGFSKAEVIKLENSANLNVVAGYYPFKGGADAAVRTLKANKIDGFIRKKSGEIFKAEPAAPKPAVKAAVKPAATKPS
jgi:hypothetical protein